jgi:phage terminase small subunit
MARPRTPTSILDGKGSFINRPSRLRPNEPIVDKPIGDPPDHMSKAERKTWRDLVKQIAPGVLMESDRLIFSVLVRLATKFTNNETMMVMETNQLITLSAKFAMNPADRSRVSVEKPKQSALSQFLAKKVS